MKEPAWEKFGEDEGIARLRRQVQKKDIVEQPRLKELFAQKAY
jgi:hypothetical protein